MEHVTGEIIVGTALFFITGMMAFITKTVFNSSVTLAVIEEKIKNINAEISLIFAKLGELERK